MPDEPGPEGEDLRKTKAGLDERISALRESRKPAPRRESKYSAASLAWRMVLELVIGMMIGLAMGWGLDSLFGTIPVFLAIFGILGFAAGVRTMMRSADEVKRKRAQALKAGPGDRVAPGGRGGTE